MDNDSIAYIELFGEILSGKDNPIDGLYWTDLEGWWGLPDLKTNSDSIPEADGRFYRAYHYRDARAITLIGHILAGSPAELSEVRYRLETALSSGSGLMKVVTSSYGSWTRTVEVDTLEIEPDHGKRYTKFTIDMVAPDPNRYSEKLTVGPIGLPVQVGGLILPEVFPWNFGSATRPVATVDNFGSVPIFPTVIVQGSGDSLVIYGGPRRMEYGAFSGTLVLDSVQRRAWLNGADVTRSLIKRDWPIIPPGSSQDFYFSGFSLDPDTTLTVEYMIGAR